MHRQAGFSWRAAGLRPLLVRLPLVSLAILLIAQFVVGAISAVAHQAPFSEYLLAARQCVETNYCPSHGGPAALEPLHHGASWIRLLSYSLRHGYDQTQVQSIVLGLLIVSVVPACFLLGRYLGLRAATLGLGLYLPIILAGSDFASLNYPNLLPLPLALYYASVALFVEFRRTVFAAVASMVLAAAVSVELGCIVMLPFHVALVALMAPTPLLAVAASCIAFAIPYCLDSMDGAIEIVRQLPTMRFAIGLAISGGVVALAARLRPEALLATSTPPPQRVRAVMTGALTYVTITVCLGALLLTHKWPQPRYFVSAMFPFLYLVAERLGALGGRGVLVLGAAESLSLCLLSFAPMGTAILQPLIMVIVVLYALETTGRQISWRGSGPLPARSMWPAVTLCVCVIAVSVANIVALSNRGPAQAVTLAQAEQLTHQLYSAGYTYPEILGSLQGPAADDMMSILMQRDPALFTAPPWHLSAQNFSLLVIKVPNAAVSRARGVIAAVPVDDSRSAIVVRSEQSYLDWIHMRQCSWTTDSGRPASYDCLQPRTDQPVPDGWPYVELGAASSLLGSRLPERMPDGSVHFEVPAHTPGHGVPHVVRTASEWPATWRVARVSGIEFEGKLPAVEVRLPDSREAEGVVEFEYTAGLPGDMPWVWLPNVMEVTQDNEHLLEPFRNVR